MAVVDDFKARFTEFDAATADQYIPILEPVWPCYYGGQYTDPCGKEIVLNLLAHLLVMETSSSPDGPKRIESKSVGSLSVSYSQDSVTGSERREFFKGTKYGHRYLMLTQHNHGGLFV